MSTTNDIRCRLCGKAAHEIKGYLHRVNELGVDGIWECRPSCDANLALDDRLLAAIESATVPTGEQDKLAFLKSKGLTVGMLKDGHGERLAYVCEPGSEFDDTVHINKLVNAELERDKWKAVAWELRGALKNYTRQGPVGKGAWAEGHDGHGHCWMFDYSGDLADNPWEMAEQAIDRFDSLLTTQAKGGQKV